MSRHEHPDHSHDSHALRNGILVAAVTYVSWGVLTIYWKQLHHFDAFELIGWRIIASAVTMAVVLTVTRRWADLRPIFTDPRLLGRVALSGVLLTINWTTYVWAVVHDHVLETALGYFIAPLGTVTLGVIVLKESLRVAQRIALLLALASVVVLTISYGNVPWLALGIAGSWTAYGYLKKHVHFTPMQSISSESFVLFVPAVVLVVALAGASDSIPNAASGTQLALVAGTGVATVVPLLMFAYAAHRVPLTIIGPMQYAVPSINFLIAWLMYDEAMPTDRVVGFALVWAGLAILTLDTARRARAARLSSVAP